MELLKYSLNINNGNIRIGISVKYYAHLFLKDKNGCSDLDSTNVQVFKKPIAEFNFPITCANKELIVSNSSFRGTSNWSKVIWSTSTWDTVNIDTTAIPMGGLTEDVELIVVNDANCADTIKKQVNKKALPRALFTAANHCLNATFKLRMDRFLIVEVLLSIIGNLMMVHHQVIACQAMLSKQQILLMYR